MTTLLTLFGIACSWAVGAIVLQLLCDYVILHLPFSIAPPRWWWSSPVPWPRSIVTAAAFAIVALVAALACLRRGVAPRQLVAGALTGLALLWGLACFDALRLSIHFDSLQDLLRVRIYSAIGYAGTVGSIAGVAAALYLGRRQAGVAEAST